MTQRRMHKWDKAQTGLSLHCSCAWDVSFATATMWLYIRKLPLKPKGGPYGVQYNRPATKYAMTPNMESGQLRANRNIASPAQSGEHSSWRAFWKILTSFNRSKMAPYMAFRNAAGMLLSLATGTATHV